MAAIDRQLKFGRGFEDADPERLPGGVTRMATKKRRYELTIVGIPLTKWEERLAGEEWKPGGQRTFPTPPAVKAALEAAYAEAQSKRKEGGGRRVIMGESLPNTAAGQFAIL